LKAFLLAAGAGTRLRPLTDHMPKCLVPVCGKPLLGRWLDLLLTQGVDEVLVNTHHLAQQVHEFAAAYPQANRVSLLYEERLLGTGGTLLRHRARLDRGAFLVAHADNLADFDVAALVHSHATRPTGVEITMLTFETDHPSSCGIVELDANAIVVAFHEKAPDPPGRRANGAVYILEPSVLDFLASLHKEAIDLSTEVLPHYLGRIRAEPLVGYLRDVGRPESLALAEEEFPRYLERRSRLQR
jgi:mannose-1-phosphate guanylyltransferase